MGKKMLILRGNADNDGDQYPDETGKNVKWPIGALHVGAAEAYAKQKEGMTRKRWRCRGIRKTTTIRKLKRF